MTWFLCQRENLELTPGEEIPSCPDIAVAELWTTWGSDQVWERCFSRWRQSNLWSSPKHLLKQLPSSAAGALERAMESGELFHSGNVGAFVTSPDTADCIA